MSTVLSFTGNCPRHGSAATQDAENCTICQEIRDILADFRALDSRLRDIREVIRLERERARPPHIASADQRWEIENAAIKKAQADARKRFAAAGGLPQAAADNLMLAVFV